jgi:hypothetical protein
MNRYVITLFFSSDGSFPLCEYEAGNTCGKMDKNEETTGVVNGRIGGRIDRPSR